MKIKLIAPRMSLRPMDSEYKRLLSPSLALLVLAALTPEGHDVWIEDENAKPLHVDDFPDLVGITVNVDTSARAYAIADQYLARDIPVVLGGIHPSACPEEAGRHATSLCIGEAEAVWPRIIHDAYWKQLQPRYYQETPVEMSLSRAPKWSLLDQSQYLYTNIVCASRGCPFACDFCYNSCAYIHHCYRNRPVTDVVAEIDRLDTRQVMFIDDNFAGNVDWVREFIAAIKSKNLIWHCAVTTNIGQHLGLLDQMVESGCRSLFIGFESINSSSNAGVHKRQNRVDQYGRLISEIHDRGMMINASMVFGFDQDDPTVFRRTFDWLVENKVETMTGHILTPYPGTVLFKRLQEQGRIIDNDYSHYNTSHVVFQPAQMSPQELKDGYLWMYDQFYSVPSIIRRLPNAHAQRVPYLLFNLGYRKYGGVTSILGKIGLMHAVGKLARRLSYGID